MEQIKNKSLLLAGVITLTASMFAGCMEEVPPATVKSEPIIINYVDTVVNDDLTPEAKTRAQSDSSRPAGSVLTSKSGKKLYLSCSETSWPSDKTAATRGTKVTTAGISNLGVSASVYPAANTYTSAGCGSYFYKESVSSGTPMLYYWPTSDYRISFFGYYPYNNAAFTVQSADNATGAPTYAYTVPSAIASQQDIMTGQVTDQPGGSSTPVNMTLAHRCAAIHFIVTNDRSEAITVNSISVEGVKYSGTLNENTWTLGSGVNSASSNPFTLTSNASIATDATIDITGTSNVFLMLPQTLPSGAKLKMVVNDEDFEADLSGTWIAGKTYTYNISVSPNMIAPTYTAPTAKTLTYTGSAQALLNAGSTSDGTIQYSSNGTSWSTTIPTGTNAGNYTVYWKIIGDANHFDKDPASISVTINKASPSYSAPVKKSLTYTGSAQSLITAGSTSHGRIQYSSNGTSWSTTIPTGTNAGDYTIYWRIVGDANHNDKNSASIAASINKANPSYTVPKNKLIAYTGSAQSLITAGSVSNGGTMQYSLNNSSWSTTVPTGTSIGDYTIYWRIVGDANHNDINNSLVSVIVNKNTSEYVNLGLPSGTIWATGNIVSNGSGGYKIGEETAVGFWFSWGNVTPHTSGDGYTFNSSNYNSTPGSSISFTSKHDGRDYPANTTYDAARACLGGSWQVPTATQYIELKDNSDRTFIYYNGVSGVLFQKKTDHSVYVFFPSKNDDSASYWFSSLQSSTHGQRFYFWNSIGTHLSAHQRWLDCLVRAVR